MKVHRSLPQNEPFFGYYAGLIPTLFKVGYLSQAFSATIETYILYSILLPKFQGASNPAAAALIGSLFLVALLEVGLRTTAAFSVRAILYKKFKGLDLPMSAFIFALCGSLLLCSVVLHVEGSKEAVELNSGAPTLEETAHIETSGQSEAAGLITEYSRDSATVAALYAGRVKAIRAAEAAKVRAYLQKKGASGAGAAGLQANAAEKVAQIEEERAAKFSALLEQKAGNLERIKSRQFSAVDVVDGRNKKRLERSEIRTATYAGYLSAFSVLTVLFFLLTIALNEIHRKGSGIEEVAIPHQYEFEEPVFAKLTGALSGKFQYHARRAIDRLEESTPAPGAPLEPHPLYDWAGLTPQRVKMDARQRKQPEYQDSANSANRGNQRPHKQPDTLRGNNAEPPASLFVATRETPRGDGKKILQKTAAEGLAAIVLGSDRSTSGDVTTYFANGSIAARGEEARTPDGERIERETFYFVDKDKAAHTIEHNGKHYTLRDVNSFLVTYRRRVEGAKRTGNEEALQARMAALKYWEGRKVELLKAMQVVSN